MKLECFQFQINTFLIRNKTIRRIEMSNKDFKEIKQVLTNLMMDLENKLAPNKEWMTLKEGANYAGVSYNTLIKFRLMGLKAAEIDGVKRVSKTEIDRFLIENSF